LEDKKQVLFKACGVEKSGIVCQEPLANIFEDATCFLHVQVPSQRTFTKKKYETESEDEEGEGGMEGNFLESDFIDVVEEVVTTSYVDTENITIKHD
jgi:hypothetical protein